MASSSGIPTSVGKFTIERLLGRGGMGDVYKAFDPILNRSVAIKMVRPDVASPAYLERMLREAQACAGLQHPNIVIVYEAGTIDGAVYIAMQFLEGTNLADALTKDELSFTAKL